MKLLLDLLAISGITLGCFIVLALTSVLGYAILNEPVVRGVVALVAGYVASGWLFLWSYDRLVFPIFPWSQK